MIGMPKYAYYMKYTYSYDIMICTLKYFGGGVLMSATFFVF